MKDVDVWHGDEAKYQKEAIGMPDMVVEGEEPKSLPGMMVKGKQQTQEKPMSWTQFRNFYATRFHLPLYEVSGPHVA